MSRRYFGTDGIRGTVGTAPMTADFVLRLGYAAGKVLTEKGDAVAGHRPTVLIGKDTRISGYMMEAALEAGFSAAGVDVLLCGPIPTPGVAYLTRALRLAAGVVISASHNPYADNGIKFFSGDGFKLAPEVESGIERALDESMGCNEAAHLGRARRLNDAGGRYVEFCKSTFPADLHLGDMKLVVDCAHGAAYQVAPDVFHELGAAVVAIGASPDGLNINCDAGATSPAILARAVAEHRADLGIALDGDGDRLVMVDHAGRLYDGDQLLYAIVKHRSMSQKVDGVAGTLMSNLALERAFARMGIPFERASVGDRHVMELMRARGWLFGGENSGHIICLDKHTTGDGIISALQILGALRQSRCSLAELTADLVLYPQVLMNVDAPSGFNWQAHAGISDAQRGAESMLAGEGRILLRPSGTEPVLRVMVEGESRDKVETAARMIAEAVRLAVKP